MSSEYVYFLNMYVYLLENVQLFTKLPPKYVHQLSFYVHLFSDFIILIGFHMIHNTHTHTHTHTHTYIYIYSNEMVHSNTILLDKLNVH